MTNESWGTQQSVRAGERGIRAGRLGGNLLFGGKMYRLSHEGKKHTNRLRFREIASIGSVFNNWMSFRMKARCFRRNSTSNWLDYMVAKKLSELDYYKSIKSMISSFFSSVNPHGPLILTSY